MQINKKIPLITVSILFLVMLTGSAISIFNYRDNYKEALLTGTLGAGFSLNSMVTELLALDLPLQSLDGLDIRLSKMLEEYHHLTYVGIANRKGKILFHSDSELVGRIFNDIEMKKCLAAVEPFVQHYNRFDQKQYHDVCIPIKASSSKLVGVIRLGFSIEIIKEKVMSAVWQAGIIFIVSFVLIAALINILLSKLVSGRIALLAEKAEQIAEGTFSNIEAPKKMNDELDSLAASLDQMSQKIQTQIEELRASQEQLENQVKERTSELLEAQKIAKLGHWHLDIATGELFWSEEIYRIFEINKEGFEASYEAFLNAVHPDDRDMVNKAYTQSVENKEPYQIIHRLLLSNGQVKWVEERGSTDYDEQNSPILSRGTVQDITKLKVADQALREAHDNLEKKVELRTHELLLAKEEAEEANRAKGIFIANMSHEFRTPLNAVLGFSEEMLEDHTISDKQKEYLKIINRNGHIQLALINDVLAMSGLENGKNVLNPREVDLRELISRIVDKGTEAAKAKNVAFNIEFTSELPWMITIDHEKLQQILSHVVDNAIKYTESGEIMLRLGCQRIENENSVLLCDVADSGIGIPVEFQTRIFQPFVQLDEQNNKIGTGLGLTLVQRYLELMGGNISLDSELGKGTIFHITLPLKSITKTCFGLNKLLSRHDFISIAQDASKGNYLALISRELNTLQDEVLAELANAVFELDVEHALEVASRIKINTPELGEALVTCIKSLDFKVLQEQLKRYHA